MAKALRNMLCLFSLIMFLTSKSFAGTEPYENFLKGQIRKNDTLVVKDEKFKNPLFNWADVTNISVQNSISLRIIDENTITRDFSCKMSLKVEYFSAPAQSQPTLIDSVKLEVNYSKAAGATYKNLATYKFNDGYYVKVTVMDINSPEFGAQLPPVLQLSNNILIERKYLFKPFLYIGLNGQAISGQQGKLNRLSSGTTTNNENQLYLTWPAVQGAEEFDVEWVTVDEDSEWWTLANDMNGNVSNLSDDQINAMFRNNATRITTVGHEYTISLLYNAKYIAVRMRQIQYDVNGIRLEGNWFYKQDNTNTYAIWPLTWHQPNLNWQYSAAYAEEGKKKEVVSYFDGTLRGRQTVTLNNSDNVALVQENVYDEFGRAAASILPAPVKESSNNPYLHYFPAFNKNNSGLAYSFTDLNAANCEPFPQPLGVSSGASQYYSNQNQFINNGKLYNKYIPDAEGYPLSVTQYTADNTGRIKLQGGVGPAFQPGTPGQSRTTKYYYGKPEQWELDRLFGNDVGYAEHYLKNMVVDPNGQISISYLNAGGKTIATALTGKSPDNVDSLNNSVILEKLQTSTLLKPEQFTFDGSALKLTATTTYLASVTGTDTLKYNIQKLISRYPGDSFQPCSNCYYDLTITVKDDCGTPVYISTSPVKIGSTTANPDDEGVYSDILPVPFNQIGAYYITFDFALSKDVIEHFTDEFISQGQTNGYLKKKEEFIFNHLSKSGFAECFSDCKTAVGKLGTKEAFTSMFKAKFESMGDTTAFYDSYINGLYDNLLVTATALQASCDNQVSPCNAYRDIMLKDVSPGGQYALVDSLGNLLEMETNVLVHFQHGAFDVLPSSDPKYQESLITKDDGSGSISPYDANFTTADLIKYWKPEWAEQFLTFHPEYCKLQFCEQNATSGIWDEKIKEIDKTSDLPAKLSGLQFNKANPRWLLDSDPFFKPGEPGYAYADSLLADLNGYSKRFLKLDTLSAKDIYQAIDFQLYCADSTATTNTNPGANNWDNCTPAPDCRIEDREWQMYRDRYLDLKLLYFQEARNQSAGCSALCPVGKPLELTLPGSNPTDCVYDGPTSNSDKNIALQRLSDVIAPSSSNAIEMWLYNKNYNGQQFMASTPDKKYMMQACISGSLLSVDIFTLQQTAPDNVSITLSNHATANIGDLLPLNPWTHLVVQGANLAQGNLEIWVNGKQYGNVPGAPAAGCGWAISSNELTMPENFGTIHHLRLYNNRLMVKTEIETNAASKCFLASDHMAMSWYRFNTPGSQQPQQPQEPVCASLHFVNGAEQLSATEFRITNYENNTQITHTFAAGNASTPPNTSAYCADGTAELVFRPCIDVYMTETPTRFNNVWQITCTKTITSSCSGEEGNLYAVGVSYNSYTTSTNDVYTIYEGLAHPPHVDCGTAQDAFMMYYGCYNVYFDGALYASYSNVYVSACLNTYPARTSFATMSAEVKDPQSGLINAVVANVDTTSVSPSAVTDSIMAGKSANQTILADYKSKSIYSISKVPVSVQTKTNNQAASNFGDYILKPYFAVQAPKGNYSIYRNVYVAEFIPQKGSFKEKLKHAEAKLRLAQSKAKTGSTLSKTSDIQMAVAQQGDVSNLVCTDTDFSIVAQDWYDNTETEGYVQGTYITVSSINGTCTTSDTYVETGKRRIDGTVQNLPTVLIPAGQSSASVFVPGYIYADSDEYWACGKLNCNDDNNNPPSGGSTACADLKDQQYLIESIQCDGNPYSNYVRRTTITLKDKNGNETVAANDVTVQLKYLVTSVPVDAVVNANVSITIPAGQSSAYHEYYSTKWYAQSGGCARDNKSFVCIKSITGANFCTSYTNCDGVVIGGNPQSTCSASLINKISRFTELGTYNISNSDTATYISDANGQINEQIRNTAQGLADGWMERLSPGLQSYPQDKIDLLRAKLIELCVTAGDMDHPFGASTLPAGKSIIVNSTACHNFGEVIQAVLGISKFTNELNPWLLDSPYPYNSKVQANEVLAASTSKDLCAVLSTLNTGNWAADDFYAELKNKYGEAMNLSLADFKILLKGCTNCKYLLEKDIKLPVFLQPGAKGCINRSEYTTVKQELDILFTTIPNNTWSNYETIVSNYLNHKWGFAFAYAGYKDFEDGTNNQLCNVPPFTSIEEDPYACAKTLIEVAHGYGTKDYIAYLNEEKEKFRKAYINTCAAAKANVDLSAKQKIYHYTLYYYDLAGNLIRTVPPEGVAFLTDEEMAQVKQVRDNDSGGCNYNGPDTLANRTVALQSLSDVLNSPTSNAVELWLYSNANGSRQFIAATPDMKYMLQACQDGKYLSVDVFSLNQTAPDNVHITLTNHVTADVSGILPLAPWTHVVVQGTSLATGALQIWVNGKAYTPVPDAPPAGCAWAINSNPLTMPDNFADLKHLRVYAGRTMSQAEIAANAANSCFMASNPDAMAWYRFNLPDPGGPTTIAENTTQETQFNGFYPEHRLATTYAYNSTNQVVKQNTPDGGTSTFWYDYLSRLVVSQNAKQQLAGDFSYTDYDVLGRITEVGQKKVTPSDLIEPRYLDNTYYRNFLSTGTNSQLTQTIYDVQPAAGNGVPTGLSLNNLRKRVAASIYRETPGATNINASYYNYDVAGNVRNLYQQVDGLGLKKIDYEYDLVSGKVNFVAYQHDQNDQFYYQYKYDAENRLIEAASSAQANVIGYGIGSSLNEPDKKVDATYEYYLHGPLARMELGNLYNKVQGLDYAYTLQGWLKGVNGTHLNGTGTDVGEDGNNNIAKDALAYSLGYYDEDYKPIGGTGSIAFGTNYKQTLGDVSGLNLYNGNISSSTYAIAKINNEATVGYTYKYDQLNRLKALRQHGLGGSGSWTSSSIGDVYKENFSYDGNGNILALQRNGPGIQAMDELTYGYNRDANGKLLNNKLNQLSDAVNAGWPGELSGQSNYTYDAIGNLVKDSKEGINDIQWSVYGKIKQIDKTDGSISYTYDAAGNRVSKLFNNKTTWYVRDAQGNSLGVYDNENNGQNWKEQQLYGSSRLGMWKPEINLNTTTGSSVANISGKKDYELSNHLGNVLAVITDNRLQNGSSYEPDVVNAQDYYAFGSQMPGRSYSSPLGAGGYRYGFNGKENDNEVKGASNQQDYGMRIYDPRIGKFLSVDPLAKDFPSNSSYAFAENDVIRCIDLEGLEKYNVIFRSFAPRGSFEGTHFESKADDRTVFQIAGDKKLSARIHASVSVDLDKWILGKSVWGQPTILGGPIKNSWDIWGEEITARGFGSKKDKKMTIEGAYHAKNGTEIGPGIDIQFGISMQRDSKNNVLNITAKITGNKFPAQETMIFDENGTGLFLGTSTASGGPLTDVWGSGKGNVLDFNNIKVQTDNKGNFQGVFINIGNGKETVISVDNYNLMFELRKVWKEQNDRDDYKIKK